MNEVGPRLPRPQAARIISIRAIGPSDDTDVLRINADSCPGVAPLDRAELRRLRAIGGLHLLAMSGDRVVVGYSLAFSKGDPYDGEEFQYFEDQIPEPFLYIDQIAIDRKERRQGVGRILYGALRDYAVSRGIHMLCCEVNTSPYNKISLDFHARLGFVEIESRTVRDARTVVLLVSAF